MGFAKNGLASSQGRSCVGGAPCAWPSPRRPAPGLPNTPERPTLHPERPTLYRPLRKHLPARLPYTLPRIHRPQPPTLHPERPTLYLHPDTALPTRTQAPLPSSLPYTLNVKPTLNGTLSKINIQIYIDLQKSRQLRFFLSKIARVIFPSPKTLPPKSHLTYPTPRHTAYPMPDSVAYPLSSRESPGQK